MKARLVPLALTAALLLSLGMVGAACGGGDEDGNGNGNGGGALTLEEYFNQMSDLKAENDKQANEVQAHVEEDLAAAESPEDAIEVFSNLIDDFSDVVSGSRDSLEAIEPPSEVEDLHNEMVAVFRTAADALGDLAAELDEGVELTDLQKIGDDLESEFTSLSTQSEVVCRQLQDIADENSIDVDLECGQADE